MYNRIIVCYTFLVIVFCTSCDETRDTKDVAIAKTDTSLGSGIPESDKLVLSPAELKDDSVFNDGSIPVSWENAGVTDPVRFKKFIRQLQVWVSENQVDSISRHIRYPVRNPGIKDSKDFKLNYSNYFSEGVKAALADQKLNQVFRNQQGVMIGQGQIWLVEKDNNILIIAINN